MRPSGDPTGDPAADRDASERPAGELPRHVAIIMDGNGRWAQSRGLPRAEGHRHGAETVRMVTTAAAERGIDALTLYCLSSENWKRPAAELQLLMTLLRDYLISQRDLLSDKNLQLQLIGRRDRLPAEVIAEVDRTEALSRDNSGTRLVLAVDYGGRDEIIRATRRIARRVAAGEIAAADIDEALLDRYLDTATLPEVDLLIRTGGDQRISNFLLWQNSYAELWFAVKCWPAFTRDDFAAALSDFATRQRRFGGLDEPV